MSGSKFSTSRGTVIYVGDFLREFGPDALRYFIAVAGPENQDSRLHLGRVRPAHQLRAGQRVGQPRQPLDLAGVQERRRDPGADVAGPGRRRPARAVAGRVRHRRRPPRAVPVQAGDLRGDADRRRGERLPVATRSPGSARTTRRAATRSCTPPCRSCRTRTPCSRRSCRTPRRRCTRRSAAPGCGPSSRTARTRASPASSAPATRCSPATTPPSRRAGRRRRSRWAGPWRSPTPLFAKLDPSLGETGPSWAPDRDRWRERQVDR